MTKLNNKLRKTYGVSRSEAHGMTMLIFISIGLLLSTVAIRYITFSNSNIQVVDQNYLDSLVAKLEQGSKLTSKTLQVPDSLIINPNNSSIDELLAVGLNKRLAARLINYRNHGGRFRKKVDVKKIYGLSDSVYQSIEAHLSVSSPKSTRLQKSNAPKIEKVKIDINTADPKTLIKIQGIGNTLANRILKYRNALGGFYNADQLKSVYGLKGYALDNILKEALVKDTDQLKKLKINVLSETELQSHPYINYSLARNILGYREKHDTIKNVNELLTNGVISKDNFEKLNPYLTTEY